MKNYFATIEILIKTISQQKEFIANKLLFRTTSHRLTAYLLQCSPCRIVMRQAKNCVSEVSQLGLVKIGQLTIGNIGYCLTAPDLYMMFGSCCL